MNPIAAIIGPAVEAVAGVFHRRTERKIAKEAIKGKVQLAKQSDATQITLTDAEWETVAKGLEGQSWKDEYVTILGTWPFAGIMLGSLMAAMGMGSEVLDGTVAGITVLKEVGVPIAEIMTGVVFAAIGLKLWRA